MNKELIDKAWACLPREFKEKVKKEYARCVKIDADDNPNLPAYAVKSAISRRALLEKIFGEHNLTSDAEGEEMLCVKASKVREMYALNENILYLDSTHKGAILLKKKLTDLFGSKCLPDDGDNLSPETKPAEPKFKVGDKVRIKGCGYEPNLHKGDIGEILDTNDKEQCFVLFKKSQAWIYVDCLEPYTEPKEREENAQERATLTDDCQSQCKIHHIGDANDMIDDIIKNSFREHNRLHIAAMMVPSVIATVPCSENEKGYAKMVATRARILADALISECKKGGENE